MKTKKLLTKALAVLLLLATATAARADVTVYVLAKQAPYIYAWGSSGEITDGFPGDLVTDVENVNGVYYFKKIFEGVNSIDMILNQGSGNNQTNNIEGVSGTVYYQFDGYETAFGIIPPQVRYIGSHVVAYFTNSLPSESNVQANIYVPNSNNYTDWNNMELVGTDGAGRNVYRIDFGLQSNFGFWNNIGSAKVKFRAGSYETQEFNYKNYGYYTTYHKNNNHSLIIDGWTVNTSRYNNAALVNALKEGAAEYYDSGTNLLTTSTALSLDLSGKSIGVIQNLTDFTNLRSLNISNNNIGPSNFAKINTMSTLQTLKAANNYPITYGDLSQLTQLRHLDMSGNSGLKGFGTGTPSSTNNILNIANDVPLQYVNLSNCNTSSTEMYLTALKNRGSAVLDTLILSGNTKMGWKSDIEGMTHLKYLDLSNTGLSYTGTNKPILTALTNLETLKLASNSSLRYADVSDLSNLKYYDIGGGDLYFNASNQLASLTAANNPNLETLVIGSANLGTPDAISGFQKLKLIDASGNSGMTAFAVNNCPALEEINFTGDTHLTNLTFTGNNYAALADMPTFTGLSASGATLDLSDNRFTEVPAIAGISLNTLKLNNNRLTSLNGAGAVGATRLEVKNNSFSGHYTYSGARLYPLQTIDFSNNSGLTGLSILNAGATESAPTASGDRSSLRNVVIDGCPSLASLAITGADLYFHNQLSAFTATNKATLTSLNFSNNNITVYYNDDFSSDYTALTDLDLSNNPMTTTRTAASSTNTGNLIISGPANLARVNVTGITTPTYLTINNTSLASVGDNGLKGIGTMTQLTSLNLNNNKVTDISGLGDLDGQSTPLKYFYLKNQTVPTGSTLSFTGHNVPERIDMSGSANFTQINLSNNHLKTAFFDGCTALTSLNVSGNQLNVAAANNSNTNWTSTTNFCLYVAGLANLQTLDISDNDFTTIGKTGQLDGLTSLKTLNAAGNQIYSITNTPASYSSLNALTALESVDLSNNTSGTGSAAKAFHLFNSTGLANLKTVNLAGNFDDSNSTHSVVITGSPLLQSVVVTGETGLQTIDLSSNALSNPVSITGWTTADAVLKYNNNNFTAIPAVPANVAYLYLLENAFTPQLTLDGGSIAYKGIALSNKATASPITSFTTTGSNSTLQALNLKGNTGLTTLKVNNFTGLTQTASSDDMTTAAGKGLYIKNLSALVDIDIAHNAFEKFGQDASTEGLSAVKTLDASHNALYTFSNKTVIAAVVKNGVTSSNSRQAHASISSLEDLTALETLKLNNNALCDSVHLWKNKNLKYLDVSNNRTITPRAAGEPRVYRDGNGEYHTWAQMEADLYTGDLNDTLGLRMLDLFFNQQLEYLNISNTAIQNTATNHFYMDNFDNPGTNYAATKPRNVPHYVLVNRCKKLKEFHADYNGMKSLGIGSTPRTTTFDLIGGSGNECIYNSDGKAVTGTRKYYENGVLTEWVTGCPDLEIVSVKGARGQDPAVMKGELNISVRNPEITYYDASDGGFDYIGTVNGSNLKYLDVSGNYSSTNEYTWRQIKQADGTYKWMWAADVTLDGKTYTYTTQGNPFELNTGHNPDIETLIAQNTPKLEAVIAQDVDKLTTLDLTQSGTNNLQIVKVDNNALLPAITGLSTLTELNTLWINDDPSMGAVDVTPNTKLERLHAQNNPQFGVSATALTLPASSTYLKTLWVSGDNLGDLDERGELTVSGYANLDSLLCDNNRINYLNVEGNTKLRNLKVNNNQIADLVLYGASIIEEVVADNNDLFRLDLSGSHPNLVELKFANNHVNAINLAGATALTQANYDDTNNGRAITANCWSGITQVGGSTQHLYYFQLDESKSGTSAGGKFIGDEVTADDVHSSNRSLRNDGFNPTKWGNHVVVGGRGNSAPRRKALTENDIKAADVYGTIAVLSPTSESSTEASGKETYVYDNGNNNVTSNFFLGWTANPNIVTGIDDLPVDGVSVTATQGGITVNAPDGTVLGIYDLQGRQVRNVTVSGGSVTIDDLAPAVYIINGQKVLVQ